MYSFRTWAGVWLLAAAGGWASLFLALGRHSRDDPRHFRLKVLVPAAVPNVFLLLLAGWFGLGAMTESAKLWGPLCLAMGTLLVPALALTIAGWTRRRPAFFLAASPCRPSPVAASDRGGGGVEARGRRPVAGCRRLNRLARLTLSAAIPAL